ncbi:unnamed protein product [Urochloa humidicola]
MALFLAYALFVLLLESPLVSTSFRRPHPSISPPVSPALLGRRRLKHSYLHHLGDAAADRANEEPGPLTEAAPHHADEELGPQQLPRSSPKSAHSLT